MAESVPDIGRNRTAASSPGIPYKLLRRVVDRAVFPPPTGGIPPASTALPIQVAANMTNDLQNIEGDMRPTADDPAPHRQRTRIIGAGLLCGLLLLAVVDERELLHAVADLLSVRARGGNQ